ncbi:MAG: acyl-CoA dehydrogenase family protein [Chloroflexota bacterium]|nr:acyl-CoA dehydrogenase family protein [Chloroflexota bacterium]
MIAEKVQAHTLPAFDFYHFDDKLNESQRRLQTQVRDWVQSVVVPHINPYWDRAEFPREIAMRLRELPIMGGMLPPTYGGAGLDAMSIGLVTYELAKGDGSIGTFYGVHSGLAMSTIGLLASEEQKARWLPAMGRMEKIGAFGLTEPERGSAAIDVQTRARRDGNHYVLNGAKRWIGNAEIADILIIWARDEDGKFCGFVIEDPSEVEGIRFENMGGKIGKRAILNANIYLDDVRVPAENRLAYVNSFKDTSMVLGYGRYGVSWEAAGCATAAFELALDYAKKREQFGKPIASYQLIQQKLVEMATEVTLMRALCFQLTHLMETGQINEGILSMAKYNNAKKARYVTQLAREVLGGVGLQVENHIARLMTDAEVIYTYEGTNEINLLLVGRTLTGINAIV